MRADSAAIDDRQRAVLRPVVRRLDLKRVEKLIPDPRQRRNRLHTLLIRRHPVRPAEVAWYLVYAPVKTAMAEIVRAWHSPWGGSTSTTQPSAVSAQYPGLTMTPQCRSL